MKQIFSTILDFPQMVNQKVFNAKLNAVVDDFNSESGIRSYVKTIYQIASLLFIIGMEYVIFKTAMVYFGNSEVAAVAKIGSILTLVLSAYSVFPLAHVIRSRGESFAGTHNGMVEFIFKDFVTTNIKIFGEVMALMGLFSAFCLSLSFIFDSDLFSLVSNNVLLDNISALYTFPTATITALMSSVGLGFITNILNAFFSYRLEASQSFGGDFTWNILDLGMVANAYINVIVGLAVLYVNLAIYNFLYSLVSNLVNFIPRMAFPLSIRKTE